MCGIAGIYNPANLITAEEIAAVDRMTQAQIHRGPDDAGQYHDSHIALGHRRLSIIDLSPSGRQPMTNEDATIHVTYNGEIYNYRELHADLRSQGHTFRSSSDTEILLHGYEQWGTEGLLARLRGMYAFALYDQRRRACILARDRYGIKPLYYTTSGGALKFASEVKALVRAGAVANEQDREGVIGFLLFGSVPAPKTSIRNVHCLLPGHYLSATVEGVNIAPAPSPINTATDLRSALGDSVARHLIADVAVGIFLSGGVDSAGLVALARQNASLNTLTVVFDEDEFSEAAPARRVAERFHTRHREIRVTAGDFLQAVPKVLAAMDQPTNDGVNTWFVSKAASEAGLKVVLSGLGGDEIFWGYNHYRWLGTRRDISRWLSVPSTRLRQWILDAAVEAGRMRGRESWMRLAYLKDGLTAERLYLAIRGFFPPHQIARLLDMDEADLHRSIDPYTAADSPSSPEAFSRLESSLYMHDQLLRDTDVFSMAHSIEVRVPYLDNEVTTQAAHIPEALKRPNHLNKPALARAIRDDLVIQLARAQKRGFTFPFAKWMRKNAKQLQEAGNQSTLLDGKAVSRLWQSFTAGRLHWSRAWATVVLAQQ